MPSLQVRHFLFAALLVFVGTTRAAGRANLVTNGDFSNPTNSLHGWKYQYTDEGQSFYKGNAGLVFVSPTQAGKNQVLRLYVATQDLAENQGVKVDSRPIPFEPGKHKFSVAAMSTGPNCRILIEGYRWRPGIKPHADPELWELRKCYKFKQIYFGSQKAGTMGGVSSAWKSASSTFPDGKLSSLAQKKYGTIRFLVIHIIGIGGGPGDLFVDDVSLEKLN